GSARRPLRVAVAALVERQDVVISRQIGRHLVPAVRGLRATVEQEHARPAGGAPVEEVEAQAVQARRPGAPAAHPSRRSLLGPICPGGDDVEAEGGCADRGGGPPEDIARTAAAGYRCCVISVAEALALVRGATGVLGSERVLLPAALGRVAAEDVVSAR